MFFLSLFYGQQLQTHYGKSTSGTVLSGENTKDGCPFLPTHPDGCLHCWEGSKPGGSHAREGGHMGKGGSFQATFNYSENGGNTLKRESSVSVVPKVLWIFDRRINRFSVKPGRLGLGEETLQVLRLS